jgi:hypothetical protein
MGYDCGAELLITRVAYPPSLSYGVVLALKVLNQSEIHVLLAITGPTTVGRAMEDQRDRRRWRWSGRAAAAPCGTDGAGGDHRPVVRIVVDGFSRHVGGLVGVRNLGWKDADGRRGTSAWLADQIVHPKPIG